MASNHYKLPVNLRDVMIILFCVKYMFIIKKREIILHIVYCFTEICGAQGGILYMIEYVGPSTLEILQPYVKTMNKKGIQNMWMYWLVILLYRHYNIEYYFAFLYIFFI